MNNSDLLHRPALDMLLTLATSDVRWPSRARLAAACGVTPSTFSNALNGSRGLSEEAVEALCSVVPGCTREALLLPVRARSGDVETARLVAEMRRLQQVTGQGLDGIASALRERTLGG